MSRFHRDEPEGEKDMVGRGSSPWPREIDRIEQDVPGARARTSLIIN